MIKRYILLFIIMIILYFVFEPLAWLIGLLFVFYICYRIYRRLTIPEGHRIRHKALRGFLKQKYGKGEGMSLYREIVHELRGKGYR